MRYARGKESALLDDYYNELKEVATNKTRLGESGSKARDGFNETIRLLNLSAGSTRAFIASFDNSFLGRQGIKLLYDGITRLPLGDTRFIKAYGKLMAQSFDSLYKGYKGADAVVAPGKSGKIFVQKRKDPVSVLVNTEIKSDPYDILGYYDMDPQKFGMRVGTEEAFPVSVPEKIRGYGRVYKATEVAYNASALRMRHFYAQRQIDWMLKNGMDPIENKEVVKAFGEYVSSVTGRGRLSEGFERAIKDINGIYFSARLTKSLFDTVYAPFKYGAKAALNSDPALRAANRQLALNALSPLVGAAGVLYMAQLAGLTDLDPRSKRFGKIQIGDKKFDITGGSGSMWGAVARIVTQQTFDYETGKVVSNQSFFNQDKSKALVDTFFFNRLAPVPGMLRDMVRGEMFGGEEITAGKIATNLLVPITFVNAYEAYEKEGFGDALIMLLAEGMGVSISDARVRPQGKEWKALLNQNKKAYEDAVNQLAKERAKLIIELRKDKKYQEMTTEEAQKYATKKENAIRNRVIKPFAAKFNLSE